jgi:uncharacterized membrane protein (DUF373 family)
MGKPSPRRPFWDIFLQEGLLKVERFFYIFVAFLILCATGVVLWEGVVALWRVITQHHFATGILKVMDSFLIALMFLEILHTVQIVFGEEYHLACVEPFLMVGIIASVRRLLILAFETSHAGEVPIERLRYYMFEMIVIGVLILALVGAVVLLRRSRRFLHGTR